MRRRDDKAGLEQAVLSELVYEKVRGSIDLWAILGFQSDLSASIERVLSERGDGTDERADLVMDCFHQAWERVSEEILSELSAQELLSSSSERRSPSDG